MDFIVEKERRTSVWKTCDVLVCGGGIAGAAAALAAVRQGKKVILAEREFLLGGLGTLGLVTIYLPLCDGAGHQVSFGIAEELFRLSIARGAQDRYPKAWLEGGTLEEKCKTRFEVQYNPWLFCVDLEEKLRREGVEILYGTAVQEVVVENGKITHCIMETNAGRSAIAVRSVVDATGDAVVARLAGADTALYSQKNVLASWYYYRDGERLGLRQFGCKDIRGAAPDKPMAGIRFTGLDPEENSKMFMLARQKMMEDMEEQRERMPGMEPVALSTIPELRMTRRLVGKSEPALTDDHKHIESSVGCFGHWRQAGPAYELPFEALWCEKIKNLTAVGRAMSAADDMWDVTRVIPVCAVSGEAAGCAAALSGDDLSALEVKTLQNALEKNGVKLHLD